jgi:hypothetical protein
MNLKGSMWYISLRIDVGCSLEEAIFDLSHEVIHMLASSRRQFFRGRSCYCIQPKPWMQYGYAAK